MRIHSMIGLSAVAIVVVAVAGAQNHPPRLREGDYLRDDYIEKLRSTRSSLKAAKIGTAQLAQLSRESDGLHFGMIFNFHEGGESLVLHNDGSFAVVPSSAPDRSVPVLKVLGNRSFQLKFDQFPSATYRFVGTAENYVAKNLLAGVYRDSRGRSYVFREDGWAVFPDRRFKYELGLDHILNRYEYFLDRGTNDLYAFEKSQGRLNIFKTYGDTDDVEAKPTLVLERVPPK